MDGVYFNVGITEGEGFAELVGADDFDGGEAAQMLGALIQQFMRSSIDPLVFQSAVMGILATAGTEDSSDV